MSIIDNMGRGYDNAGTMISDGWDKMWNGGSFGSFLGGLAETTGGLFAGLGNTITLGYGNSLGEDIADHTEIEDFDGDGTLDMRLDDEASGLTKVMGSILEQPTELMGKSTIALEEAIADGDDSAALKAAFGMWGGLGEVAAYSVAAEMGGHAIVSGIGSMAAGTTTLGSAFSGAGGSFAAARTAGSGILRSSGAWFKTFGTAFATTKAGIVASSTLSLAGAGFLSVKASDFAKSGEKSIDEYLITDLNGHETDSIMMKLKSAGCLTAGKEDEFQTEFLNLLNGIDKGINYNNLDNVTQVGEQYDIVDALRQLEQKGLIEDAGKTAEIVFTDYYNNYYGNDDFPESLRNNLIKASTECACGTVDTRFYCQTMYAADGYMNGLTMDQATAYADYMTSFNMGDLGDISVDELTELFMEDEDLKDVDPEIFETLSYVSEMECYDVMRGVQQSTLSYFKELGLISQEDIDSGSLPEDASAVVGTYYQYAMMYTMGAMDAEEVQKALRAEPMFEAMSDDQLFGYFKDTEGFEQYASKETTKDTEATTDVSKDFKDSVLGIGAAIGVAADNVKSNVKDAAKEVVDAVKNAEGTIPEDKKEEFKEDVKKVTETEISEDGKKEAEQVYEDVVNNKHATNSLNFFRALSDKIVDVCPAFATVEAVLMKGASNIISKLCNTEDKYAGVTVASLASSIVEQAEVDAVIYGDKVLTSEDSRLNLPATDVNAPFIKMAEEADAKKAEEQNEMEGLG